MQQEGVRGQTQRVSPNILSGLNQQQTRGGARVSPIDKHHTYNDLETLHYWNYFMLKNQLEASLRKIKDQDKEILRRNQDQSK